MDWIKKSYEQFVLAIAAVILLAASGFLMMSARSLQVTIPKALSKSSKMPELDTSVADAAMKQLQAPGQWKAAKGSLLVSKRYILGPNASLVSIDVDDPNAAPLHPPVPNVWWREHDLDITSSSALTDDPDQDGFSNLIEWIGADPANPGAKSTDPQNKDSHPSYISRLRLKRYIAQPFRLQLKAWDGDPSKPETLSFQINTVDVRQPTQFVELNKQIAGTKFKTVSFKANITKDANDIEKDVSELTVENQETGAKVVLVVGATANSPDSYALFEYLWEKTQKRELQVKKDATFSVDPESDQQFKLIDIKEGEALIENLKTGEKITVPPSGGSGRP